MSIAGHLFSPEGRCVCGYRFSDIAGALPEHVGKPHWAHQGSLTHTELLEIQIEVRRIWELTAGVATGSGPAEKSAPGENSG